MNDLNERSKKLLEFISSFQKERGTSPSIEEIKDSLGTKSTRGAIMVLEKLQKLGYIDRSKKTRRSIKILRKPTKMNDNTMIDVPIIGEIKAGYNAFAQESREGKKKIPISLAEGRSDAFLLRVRGESMLGAGIRPGDLVIIAPQNTAENNDIVVALDPEEETATLKRYRKLNDYIVLLPESNDPQYRPVIGRQFVIQGKMLGVLPASF